jgi:hypothetical protein
MHRADDVGRVAASLQHQRLAMAAHIGQQFDAGLVAHEHERVVGPGQRLEVACIGHHQFVPDVTRSTLSNSSRFSASKSGASKYQDTGNCV